jgi:hypothetical protein
MIAQVARYAKIYVLQRAITGLPAEISSARLGGRRRRV